MGDSLSNIDLFPDQDSSPTFYPTKTHPTILGMTIPYLNDRSFSMRKKLVFFSYLQLYMCLIRCTMFKGFTVRRLLTSYCTALKVNYTRQ